MCSKKRKIIKGFFLSFVPLFCFVFFVYGSQQYLTKSDSRILLASISEQGQGVSNNLQTEFQVIESDNEGVENQDKITAKSAFSVLVDDQKNQREFFSKDKNLKVPIASLTKLMTAIIVLDNYDISKRITLNESAAQQLPMQIDFKTGDNFSIDQFLHVMLVESSNKAAYALAEQIGEKDFIYLMNEKSKTIGLSDTLFVDPTGLSSENVSTAKDLSILAEYIIEKYPKILEITTLKKYYLEGLGEISNTNQLLDEFPEIILGKTGFTNYANGCLLVVLKSSDGSYFVNVVLGADDRFSEMKKIIKLDNQK